jgi:hypothetical protein
MKTNEHTYATIKKLDNYELYKVVIKRTWDTNGIFGKKSHEELQEIPFIFLSDEIAKDFVSVLPDKIEKTAIKKYECEICHLCYAAYETYKLTIGNFEVYVKWNWTNRYVNDDFIGTRTFLKPNKKEPIVESFMLNGTPERYTNGIITTREYKKLSELIKYLKDNEDKKIENNNEQTFELIQNA